ncbi:hypothetical protein MLD38_024744 [Melastoma candidum]|uniref:Uncharacterized protein n=1 Tax=Melastoma candidum TaxID=119954 RepID=A0ACB9NWP8_9MYRT|nr:hypothetical protein MLD38_024744 [Melastoma candidum]
MHNGETPDSKDQPHGQDSAVAVTAAEEESNSQVQTTQNPPQQNHHHYQQRWRPPPPPQPWIAMHQYHPAAVVMHPQHQQQFPAAGVLPQHYYGGMQFVGYPHHHHHPHQGSNQQGIGPGQSQRGSRHKGSNNGESNRTIWVGDLHHWMDENYLHSCFASSGEIASIKVIRNKHTGLSEGYGFVEFFSHAMAEKVLQNYAGTAMPNADQPFRLNWASFSTVDKHPENGSDLSIFVGDLAADVTDSLLHETFASKYPSVKAAKVVFDVNTGRSKGYGFVRFGDDSERSQAMTEMNGAYCLSRPMRIGAATPRKTSLYPQQYSPQGSYLTNRYPARGLQSDGESTNTTIFVGGLDPNVSDDDLRQPFSQYGEIVSVKIPANKGCGFIQFANRSDAEEALEKLNGTAIGKQTVRLSWGRNPAMKQFRNDFGNQWGPMYYGGQIYDGGYGYGLPPTYDPGMYAAANSAYTTYPAMCGGHQQQVS